LSFSRPVISCSELQQCSGAQHLGGTAWILFAGELEDQLIITNRLESGFGHAQAIDAPLEHIFDSFQLLFLHAADAAGRQHLQGELAATAQVEAELQGEGNKQGPSGNRQGQDQGEPPLLACHRAVCLGEGNPDWA
jgi:hypothetical protein